MPARCSSSAVLAVRRAAQSASTAETSFSRPAKASSRRRWVAASTSARSSCWPWISTRAAPTAFSVCTLIAWSLMKARVRPSASWTRRRIISPVSSSPFSARILAAGWFFGISNTAVTCPCSAPWRTRPASPRPPSANAKASSRMDLPAPVSPVKTARPGANSISSRSIRTMSRIDRRASMELYFLAETHFLEGLANPGPLILARFETARFYKIIDVLVPATIRKIVPEHGGGRLGLADDADRHIGLGQAVQRLFDMAGGLVLRHHGLVAVDRRRVVALLRVIAADVHFLAGELVARTFDLGLGRGRIFGGRIFAHHLFQRGDRLLGAGLVAADVRNLVVMRGGDQILRVGRIRAAGMQRDVAGGRADAAVVVAALVGRVARHQQRFAGPVGIRMLAVDLFELLVRRLHVLLLVHEVQALIVDLVCGLLDEGVVLGGELVPKRAGAAAGQRQREHEEGDNLKQPTGSRRDSSRRDLKVSARHTLCRHEYCPDALWCGVRQPMNPVLGANYSRGACRATTPV